MDDVIDLLSSDDEDEAVDYGHAAATVTATSADNKKKVSTPTSTKSSSTRTMDKENVVHANQHNATTVTLLSQNSTNSKSGSSAGAGLDAHALENVLSLLSSDDDESDNSNSDARRTTATRQRPSKRQPSRSTSMSRSNKQPGSKTPTTAAPRNSDGAGAASSPAPKSVTSSSSLFSPPAKRADHRPTPILDRHAHRERPASASATSTLALDVSMEYDSDDDDEHDDEHDEDSEHENDIDNNANKTMVSARAVSAKSQIQMKPSLGDNKINRGSGSGSDSSSSHSHSRSGSPKRKLDLNLKYALPKHHDNDHINDNAKNDSDSDSDDDDDDDDDLLLASGPCFATQKKAKSKPLVLVSGSSATATAPKPRPIKQIRQPPNVKDDAISVQSSLQSLHSHASQVSDTSSYRQRRISGMFRVPQVKPHDTLSTSTPPKRRSLFQDKDQGNDDVADVARHGSGSASPNETKSKSWKQEESKPDHGKSSVKAAVAPIAVAAAVETVDLCSSSEDDSDHGNANDNVDLKPSINALSSSPSRVVFKAASSKPNPNKAPLSPLSPSSRAAVTVTKRQQSPSPTVTSTLSPVSKWKRDRQDRNKDTSGGSGSSSIRSLSNVASHLTARTVSKPPAAKKKLVLKSSNRKQDSIDDSEDDGNDVAGLLDGDAMFHNRPTAAAATMNIKSDSSVISLHSNSNCSTNSNNPYLKNQIKTNADENMVPAVTQSGPTSSNNNNDNYNVNDNNNNDDDDATLSSRGPNMIPTPPLPLLNSIGGKLYDDLRHSFIRSLIQHAKICRQYACQRGTFDAALRAILILALSPHPVRTAHSCKAIPGIGDDLIKVLCDAQAGHSSTASSVNTKNKDGMPRKTKAKSKASKSSIRYVPPVGQFSTLGPAALVAMLQYTQEHPSQSPPLCPVEELFLRIPPLVDSSVVKLDSHPLVWYLDKVNLCPEWNQIRKLCVDNVHAGLDACLKERRNKKLSPTHDGLVYELLPAGLKLAKRLQRTMTFPHPEPGPMRQLPASYVSNHFKDVTICVDNREGGGAAIGLHRLCDDLDVAQAPYVVRTLKIADYVFFVGDQLAPILIERKSAEDLAGSLADGRWLRQQQAMRKAQYILGNGSVRRCDICYLVEGDASKKVVHGGNVGRQFWNQVRCALR
jgi:hypothetical protein